jgi:hypothetical protein
MEERGISAIFLFCPGQSQVPVKICFFFVKKESFTDCAGCATGACVGFPQRTPDTGHIRYIDIRQNVPHVGVCEAYSWRPDTSPTTCKT